MRPDVAIVTGCSRGLGFETAMELARRGLRVYPTVRKTVDLEKLRKLATETGLELHPRLLDLTNTESFDPFIRGVVSDAGHIDILINNAGVLKHGALEDLPETGIREVFETNTLAPILLTRSLLPCLRAQMSGRVVMICSLSGLAGLAGDVAYSASKFALEGATEALRHEVDRWNISLALVYSGQIGTNLFGFEGKTKAERALGGDSESPYRPLIEARLRSIEESRPTAASAADIARQVAHIALSKTSQFRWATDAISRKVLELTFPAGETARESFLRSVDGTSAWSTGGRTYD